MFTILYHWLLLISEVIKCLGYARCYRPLRIQVAGVDLRLVPIANGVTSLYREHMYII